MRELITISPSLPGNWRGALAFNLRCLWAARVRRLGPKSKHRWANLDGPVKANVQRLRGCEYP